MCAQPVGARFCKKETGGQFPNHFLHLTQCTHEPGRDVTWVGFIEGPLDHAKLHATPRGQINEQRLFGAKRAGNAEAEVA